MTKKQIKEMYRKALNLSILHWWMMSEGYQDSKETGIDSCALCRVGIELEKKRAAIFRCEHCPIYKKTGIKNCEHTPYVEARRHNGTELSIFQLYARKELKFLKTLRGTI